MKTETKVGLVGLVVVLVIIAICTGIWRYSTEGTATITVERGERINGTRNTSSYYLIWAVNVQTGEKETFKVSDDMFHGTFSASDTYGQLLTEPGKKTFEVKTTGKRAPILSWYRNIYSVKEVPSTAVTK